MSIFRNVVLNLKTEEECNRVIDLYKQRLSSLENEGLVDVYICRLSKDSVLFFLTIDNDNNAQRIFEIMHKPILTSDQLKLLRYDNVLSGKYKSNSDIGVPSLRYFDEEVKKYCYMWKDGGQFSTEKYKDKNNFEAKTN